MTGNEIPSEVGRHVCARQAGEPVWLLARAGGGWIAECGVPGCAWHTSHDQPEQADDVGAGHVFTVHAPGVIGEEG